MAAPDETKVFRCGGALWLTPTSITPPAYGTATRFGICHEVRLSPVVRQFNLTGEEYGGEMTEGVYMGRDWTLTALVRGWDNDTLSRAGFYSTATGGSSGNLLISEPGGLLPGSLLSGRAVKLLFAPDDTAHKGFIVYKAFPNLQSSTQLNFSTTRDLTFVANWRCLRDPAVAGGRALKIGQVADLSV